MPKTSPSAHKSAPRRGRPPTISSERLLEVAREVFLERGIRATTLEVAERAGVSEGTLFHRFKSKENLFREAMNVQQTDGPSQLAAAIEEVRDMDIESALTRLAEVLLEVGRVTVPLMMMSWSNPDQCGPTPAEKQRYYGVLKLFSADIQGRIDRGELRALDPEVFARSFLGAVHQYAMGRTFSEGTGLPLVPEGMFVRGLVDLVLRGASPPAGRLQRRRSSGRGLDPLV